MAAPWEFPAPNPWDPTIPVPTPNPWEPPAPNPWEPPAPAPAPVPNPEAPAPAPSTWDAPIQTIPGDGGSWFEPPSVESKSWVTLTTANIPPLVSPTDWATLTTANIPPLATPTGLAEETPAKGTTGWLYATIGCIIVIIFLLIFNCVQRTTINMSIQIVSRSLPEDKNSSMMVVTVSAIMVLIVSGLIGYVIFVARPRPIHNVNAANGGRPVRNNANNPVRTLHYTNGSWERFPQAPISQGFAVQYLRHILQRARAITGRDRAPDNEAQDNRQNQNTGAQQHDNVAGHGQNSGGQGHDSGGHDGIRPATA
ncbi:hypothetical protein CEP52_014354 [Fusarium oligoseptatum]|uniref:Uncharacterized protein n=1 Tax=Fusarium oligoseptatum TaxID=2604345 RepID=A0A428SMW1_9HYPO|nr:hypothetical protein CEP52_014354 [Fusarium oligoseptatum]